MSSSDEDEESPIKRQKVSRVPKQIRVWAEWKDAVGSPTFPNPEGQASPPPPTRPIDLTPPPQDAKYVIDQKDVLRPMGTSRNATLSPTGYFFLGGFTKTWVGADKKKKVETIRLLDEVESTAPTEVSWHVISITGTPYGHSGHRRCMFFPCTFSHHVL